MGEPYPPQQVVYAQPAPMMAQPMMAQPMMAAPVAYGIFFPFFPF